MPVTRLGQEILVNTASVGDQAVPQTTAVANGGFVVTWEDDSGGVGGAAGDTSLRSVSWGRPRTRRSVRRDSRRER
jgi:hypothetical protein